MRFILMTILFVILAAGLNAQSIPVEFKLREFSIIKKKQAIADIHYRFDVFYTDPNTFVKKSMGSIVFSDDDGIMTMLIARNAALNLINTLEKRAINAKGAKKAQAKKELKEACAQICAFYGKLVLKLEKAIAPSKKDSERIKKEFKLLSQKLQSFKTANDVKGILIFTFEDTLEKHLKKMRHWYSYAILNVITSAMPKQFNMPPTGNNGMGSGLSKAILSSVNRGPSEGVIYVWRNLNIKKLMESDLGAKKGK